MGSTSEVLIGLSVEELEALADSLLAPAAQARQNLRSLLRSADPQAVDRDQRVSFVNPGLLRRASGRDVHRHREHLAGHQLVGPGGSIIGHVEFALLLEINRRGDQRRHGDNHQQSVRELLPQFPHSPENTTPAKSDARRLPI